jgi:hypothetical protein
MRGMDEEVESRREWIYGWEEWRDPAAEALRRRGVASHLSIYRC